MVGRAAGRIANTVPSQDLASLDDRWADYQRLSSRSVGPATWRLESMLKRRTHALDRSRDRLVSRGAVRGVERAVDRRRVRRWCAPWPPIPARPTLNAALRYCDGHLHRINGDEFKRDKKMDAARREFAAAITAFREAAELRDDWPDPFIGLARTFVSGLGDVDRGADALEQARRLGYTPGERDVAQLADGYADRGDTLRRTARDLRSVPQERDYLNRAAAGVSARARALRRGGHLRRRARERPPRTGGARPHAAAAGRARLARPDSRFRHARSSQELRTPARPTPSQTDSEPDAEPAAEPQ